MVIFFFSYFYSVIGFIMCRKIVKVVFVRWGVEWERCFERGMGSGIWGG